MAASAATPSARAEAPRRVSVAFANITEEPGARLEATGFTGTDVREGFQLAARLLPVDLVFYDNALDGARALANVRDAIRRRVNVYLCYGWDPALAADIGRLLAEAAIPALAIAQPIPGAPLYTADNAAAGRIAGEALARHATTAWAEANVQAAIVGPPAGPGNRLDERIRGIAAGLKSVASDPARLDTGGNPLKVEGLLRGFLGAHPGQKVLVAALDDATALAAKATIEAAGRAADAVVVSQGCDRSIHGNASERRELDPANRGSLLLGSVAFFLDRYGYDVLPLALKLAAREPIPPVTTTRHRLITPANAFVVYPPFDIN